MRDIVIIIETIEMEHVPWNDIHYQITLAERDKKDNFILFKQQGGGYATYFKTWGYFAYDRESGFNTETQRRFDRAMLQAMQECNYLRLK